MTKNELAKNITGVEEEINGEKIIIVKEGNDMKIEIKNGLGFIAGNFVDDIENDNEQLAGLHIVNAEIVDYDEDGVFFELDDNTEVYMQGFDGTKKYIDFE